MTDEERAVSVLQALSEAGKLCRCPLAVQTIATVLRLVRQDEREACAVVCDEAAAACREACYGPLAAIAVDDAARMIRARKDTP